MPEVMFTHEEREVLALYRDPKKSGLGRSIRLSIQYLIGAGIFVYLAIVNHEPLYSLITYGVFVVYVLIRLSGARRLAGVLPRILAKYEACTKEVEGPESQSSQ